jgi:hypothetical protein
MRRICSLLIGVSPLIATVVALTSFSPGTGLAQAPPPADTFSIGFYVNANQSDVADGTVFITNPGASGGVLCADIYVFDASGEMAECCGCPVPQNGLLTLSINRDLTGDPLTGVPLTDGVIKVISSSASVAGPGQCDARKPKPMATLRGDGEIPAQHRNSANSHTSEGHKGYALHDAPLTSKELASLKDHCAVITTDGSGHAVCSCGSGSSTSSIR